MINKIKESWNKKSDKQKNRIIIFICFVILTSFFGYSLYNHYQNARNNALESFKTHLVKDNNSYYTALSSANKFINYISNNSKTDIYSVLEPEYVKSNNITLDNLNNFLPKINDGLVYDYVVNEMYQKRISKHITEYYLYGNIRQEKEEDGSTIYNYREYPLTVILYENKIIFSIRPGGEVDGR